MKRYRINDKPLFYALIMAAASLLALSVLVDEEQQLWRYFVLITPLLFGLVCGMFLCIEKKDDD